VARVPGGRTIGDLQTIGFLTGKGYFAQAYSSARMTYECCDLADLFWADRTPGGNGSRPKQRTVTSAAEPCEDA
jgi:hypothetical protein